MPATFKSKLPLLSESIHHQDALIVAFTESHLNHNIKDAEVTIAGYTSFRTDRTNTIKGGVITYIKDELAPYTEVNLSSCVSNTEAQVLHIKRLDLIFITIYRPPACTDFKTTLENIRIALDKIPPPSPTIIITGDFNFPIINWTTDTINSGTSADKSQAQLFLTFIEDYCLTQIIHSPTRLNNILDLFLTNNEHIIHNYETYHTNLSDHNLITVTTSIDTNGLANPACVAKTPVSKLTFSDLNFYNKNVDWDALRAQIAAVDWLSLLSSQSVDAQLDTILRLLLEACVTHVPRRPSGSNTTMIPRDRRALMRARTRLRKKSTTNQHDRDLINAKIDRINTALVNSAANELHLKEAKAVAAIKTNPKFFYKYAFTKSKARIPVGPLTVNDNIITDPQAISNTIKHQYETVFSTPLPSKVIHDKASFFNSPIERAEQLMDVSITSHDITNAIKTLKKNSAAGPDHLPAILLKQCALEVSVPLLTFYRESLASGVVPQLLRSARITPIYKGGSRGEAKNYRPIALTSHLVKTLEKIIVSKITTFLESTNQLNKGQHGFRRGRSCLSQLLAHYERIISALESNTVLDVIYLDFAKAFDKVDHGVLLHKLRDMGISGRLGLWISEFLTNRTQFVAVGGSCSDVSPVVSGVPQGSVLGPLLFLIHIHDIDHNITHSTVTSFADDTRISKTINNQDDAVLLQKDLDTIYQWAATNNMAFNNAKFEHLTYNTNPSVQPTTSYTAPDGSTISNPSEVQDLGVCFSSDATFSTHISVAAKKARSQLGWIMRTFHTRDPFPMLTLYKSLVVPLLEYCCQLWSPWTPGDIRALEAVQRSFTHRITIFRDLNYWERLSALGLYSLQRRRERYAILYIWKIMRGLVSNDIGISFYDQPRLGRLCTVDRVHPRALTRVKTLKTNAFATRGPTLFNALPITLRAKTDVSLETFKATLDRFLRTLPDEPPMPQYHSRSSTNSIVDWLAIRRADGKFTYHEAATHRDLEAEQHSR